MAASSPALTPEYLAQDDSGKTITVMWIVTGLPIVFICLRLYSRGVLAEQKRLGWDDGIAVLALANLIAYAACTTAAARKGLGQHVEAVAAKDPQNLIDIALLADISEALAITACTLGKSAFAVTLLRIMVQRWIKWVIYFILLTMNLVNYYDHSKVRLCLETAVSRNFICVFFIFLQCKNPTHLWNPAVPSKCWPTHVFTDFSLFVGAYSGAQDFVLAVLPWPVLMKLQMRQREKIGIALAMSLGIFAGATAIVKTTFLVNLSKKTDFTFALPPLLMWAAAEDGLTLVAGSIPTLRPLLKKISSRSKSGSSHSHSHSQSYQLSKGYNTPPPFVPQQSYGQSGAHAYRTPSDGDDNSDKSILDKTGGVWMGDHKIKRTTEVSVAHGVA